jgi:hypothetical protein
MEANIKSGEASTAFRLAYAAADHARTSSGKKRKRSKSKDDREKKEKNRKKSSSSSVSDSTSDSSFFLKASPRPPGSAIVRTAQQQSGRLYEETVSQLEGELGRRGGAGGKQGAMWKRYISSVLEQKHPDIPKEKLQELFTLAETLEKMEDGDLDSMGDIMAQRFKSIEWELAGAHAMAQSVQLAQPRIHGLTSATDVLMAERAALYDERVRKARAGPS